MNGAILYLPLKNSGLPLTSASPRFVNLYSHTEGPDTQKVSAIRELEQGLQAAAASIPPKYFYNALGSKLFEAITALDEYYPTRTEAAIFADAYADIAAAVEQQGISQTCLIDLGAGSCAKAAQLMPHLRPRQYVPVDISVDFLRDAADQVQCSFPMLDIIGVGTDFSAGLALPDEVQSHDRVFFYPGSSLGNFTPDQSLEFLQRISDPAQGKARGLLLGIDLVKDTATLEAAYDDALGVTAAFNKNMLLHINSLLGSDFDIRQWQHVALFDRENSRIEMHLQATCAVDVHWPGGQRHFTAGERIHTECSYKYTVEAMTALLKKAGFRHVQHWSDPKDWFAVFWAAV